MICWTQAMLRVSANAKWVPAAAAALLLTPVATILYLPMALGHGLDVFALGDGTPLALALCVPGLCVLLQYLGPQAARALPVPAPER